MNRAEKDKRIKELYLAMQNLQEKCQDQRLVIREIRESLSGKGWKEPWNENMFSHALKNIQTIEDWLTSVHMIEVRLLLPTEEEVILRCIREAPRDV